MWQSINKQLGLYQQVWPYYRPFLGILALGLVAAMLVGALDAVMPLGIKLYLELFIEKTGIDSLAVDLPAFLNFLNAPLAWVRQLLASDSGAWLIPIGIVAFTLIQGSLSYVSIFFTTRVSAEVTASVKRDIYEHLVRFDTSFFDTTDSGFIQYRIHNDGDTGCASLVHNVKATLTRFFSLIALAITLVVISWKLAIVALVVLGSSLIPLGFARRYLKKVSNQQVIATSQVVNHFTESCQGNRVIASYGLAQYQSNKLQRILNSVKKIMMRLASVQGLITPFTHTIAGAGIGLVLWFGTHLIQRGELSIGGFAAFLTSLVLLYTPVKSLSNMAINVQLSILALERLFAFKNHRNAITSPADAPKLKSLGSGVQLEQLSFRYGPQHPEVLKAINLTIHPGETVALVGASGSGKTTLAHLLLRLYDPTEGRILLDGQDMRSYNLASVRDQMAAVFQDNFMFIGTIRENIGLGRENATEEELWDAIRAAYLEDFVKSLPSGLDTEVGERGISLSGGQKQRLAIARALVKNAELVVLDEATSALDNQSEAIVQKALDKLMENRTVLVIAHRLSTIQNADRIVVMDQGRIIEVGKHEELLAKEGLYRLLYEAQFKNQRANEAEAGETLNSSTNRLATA